MGFKRICGLRESLFALACTLPILAQTNKLPGTKCNATDCLPKPGADPKPAKPAVDQFPFPEEDSRRGGETKSPSSAEMPTTGVPDPPASSEQPMHLPPGSSSSGSGDDAPAGSPVNPGHASSSRSADDDDVAPTSADPNAPVKASALKDLGSRGDTSLAHAKLEQTRVADDVKVGTYYLQQGNMQGAYLRFKDAADRAPDEPGARFGLAEAASRLNKRDEAVLNYRAYLQLDAGGDHDKAARKALSRLNAAAR